MKYVLTASEMRNCDYNTIQKIGIQQAVLMERAALSVYEEIKCLEEKKGEDRIPTVLIVASIGNNGGDGLALARLLCEEKYRVYVWIVGKMENASAGFFLQYSILLNYPVEFITKPENKAYTYIVDALFGTGLSRKIEGIYENAVSTINALEGYKIALDIPSGICSDTGAILGCCVKADLTVAFAFAKRGHFFYPGCLYVGELSVKDIGISERAFDGEVPKMFYFTEDYKELLPRRKADGNKGTFGKVLIVAGSHNMAGAACLSAKACARVGAGMVKVITPEENRVIVQTLVPEALLGTVEDLAASLAWADAILIGPGLGKSESAKACLEQVIYQSALPLVIDADGLNLLSEDKKLMQELSKQCSDSRTVVMTPHMGEFSRLTGKSIGELKNAFVDEGSKFAAENHLTVVVKDARTIVCSKEGTVFLNTRGNSGMATAGSGDVLAGLIAGLLVQGDSAFDMSCKGVYIHASLGDSVAKEIGEHALMAGDLLSGKLF